MKKLLPFILLITSLSVFSQIPSYYNDVNMTLTGSALKDELATKIISTHHTFISYTPGAWDALKQADISPNNPASVILIYGWDDSDADITNDYTRGKDNHGSGIGVWNREHVYSKSLANPNLGTTGPGADAHNLRPCDSQRNSSRSNRKFATGSGTPSYITPEGNWYPGDEWKGDVARMMMYMYLRYGNQCLPTGVGVGNTLPVDSDMIDLFLQWNAEDPVSILEKQRNPVLENVQGNRNPFIDNPVFATQIWGGALAEDLFGTNSGTNDTVAPAAPTGLVASNTTQTTVNLAWSASTDNIAVAGYNIFNGSTQIANTFSTNYLVTGLAAGISYNFTVVAYDAASNVSVNSNAVAVTTIPSGTGTGIVTELLISEYAEGTSYNKAIEIANFTGSSVNLSNYSLKKATNGGGAWSSSLALSGTLANDQVYVITHGSASQEILNIANITDGGVLSFNGNDAVGLFKNDVLIDLVGDPNSNVNFAQDVTLQRNTNVTSPNTTYTTTEWTTLNQDTFNGLGSHTIEGGTIVDTTAPTIPTNLIASNITQTTAVLNWAAATDDTAVTGYDVYQNDVKITTVTSTNYAVAGLDTETAYNFIVTAFDASGNTSAQSAKVFITTLPIPDTEAPSAPSTLVASNITQTTLNLTWTASTDNTGVTAYDVYQDNVVIATVSTINHSVNNLTTATSYNFYVVAKDAAGNISLASNTVNVTTESEPTNGTTSDLLISEYVEGSSNNKAIEIANFTGTTADLSAYSLKKATNGGGVFNSTMALSGSLANGQVFVIANTSATTAILNVADVTNGGVLTFNGNDAIGLFKNDVLIDVIGDPSSTANFGKDVTLRRKSSISNPNVTYVVTEWDSYTQNTFDGLGNHDLNGVIDTTAPTTPTNLVSSNIIQNSVNLSWNASTDNTAVTGYDVYRGVTKIATVTSTNYTVSGLTASTTYSFSVRSFDAASNVSSSSNTVTITTLANIVSYCNSQGNNDSYEWIDNVVIGGISNTTGANAGYGNFTNLTGSLGYGNNTIIVSAAFSGASYTEFWKVWIDFNQNGTFESSEEVVSGSSSSSGNLSYPFSVPTSANSGATRMRVSMKWDATPTACENFSYGEVEDYTVNIGSSSRGIATKNSAQVDGALGNEGRVFDATIYPNPSSDYININLKDGRNATFKIVNLIGQTVKKGQADRNVDIRDLQAGMYVLEVNDGQRALTKKFIKK